MKGKKFIPNHMEQLRHEFNNRTPEPVILEPPVVTAVAVIEKPVEKILQKNECPECGKICKHAGGLMGHMKSHKKVAVG